jgi:hypothetical protein
MIAKKLDEAAFVFTGSSIILMFENVGWLVGLLMD